MRGKPWLGERKKGEKRKGRSWNQRVEEEEEEEKYKTKESEKVMIYREIKRMAVVNWWLVM